MAVGAAKVQISGRMLRQGMAPVWIDLAGGATLRMLLLIVCSVSDSRVYYLAVPMLILTTGLAALIPSNQASKVARR